MKSENAIPMLAKPEVDELAENAVKLLALVQQTQADFFTLLGKIEEELESMIFNLNGKVDKSIH